MTLCGANLNPNDHSNLATLPCDHIPREKRAIDAIVIRDCNDIQIGEALHIGQNTGNGGVAVAVYTVHMQVCYSQADNPPHCNYSRPKTLSLCLISLNSFKYCAKAR